MLISTTQSPNASRYAKVATNTSSETSKRRVHDRATHGRAIWSWPSCP